MTRQNRAPQEHAELDRLVLGALTDLTDNLAQLRHGITSRDSNQRRGANYTPLPINGTGVISYSAGYLAGWSVIETSGNAGFLALYDGTSATDGVLLAVTSVLATAGETRWLLPHGVGFTHGLYVAATTTTLVGAIYTSPVR